MADNFDFLDPRRNDISESDSDIKDNWDDESEEEKVKKPVVKVIPKPKQPNKSNKPEPIDVPELSKEEKELKIKETDREIAGELFGVEPSSILQSVDAMDKLTLSIDPENFKPFELFLDNFGHEISNSKIHTHPSFTRVFGRFLKISLQSCNESKLHDLMQIIRNMKEELSKKHKATKSNSKKGPTLKNAGNKLKSVKSSNCYDAFIDEDEYAIDNNYDVSGANYIDEDDFM